MGFLKRVISELNTQPADTPVQRFKCSLTTALTWLGARVVRYSFPVRLFHSLLRAGLSRRCPPMPPAPRGTRISYGPRRVPETSGIYLERFYSSNSKSCVTADSEGGTATQLTGNAQTAVVRVLGQKSRLWEITDAVATCRS